MMEDNVQETTTHGYLNSIELKWIKQKKLVSRFDTLGFSLFMFLLSFTHGVVSHTHIHVCRMHKDIIHKEEKSFSEKKKPS